jgi:cellulose synthase/poly-beta-1,6-N-acetylglucosamine synthase-like glycosyltransferase
MPAFLSGHDLALCAFLLVQVVYALTFVADMYLFSLPANLVDMAEEADLRPGHDADWPFIVLFYPVLKEARETMRTTFRALAKMEYPRHRYKVVAIPNASDEVTVQALRELQREFPFLELLPVPPTSDPSWNVVWAAWETVRLPDGKPAAYWWHEGARARNRDLPPKKTRQLIYAFYRTACERETGEDFLVNYIDADSAPPKDHFLAAAIGIRRYDVLQSKNIAGNLLDSWAATFCAMDHMAWDGFKYQHLSSNGRNPFWVLGKGLFFKASDLLALGGFHPWITIEDPEVGMRFWKNGRRLGVIEGSLIEEVPNTFRKCVIQRKRWVAGFFQSLTVPLDAMGFTFREKLKAWAIFLPCLSLSFNVVGLPVAVWLAWDFLSGAGRLPAWTVYLALANLAMLATSLTCLYINTWQRTRLVETRFWRRLRFMLRVNPLCLMLWWTFWTVPLAIGFRMWRKDLGLEWERTEKLDRNGELVPELIRRGTLGYDSKNRIVSPPAGANIDLPPAANEAA